MKDHAATPFLAALDAAGELVLPLEGASMGPAWAEADGVLVTAASHRAPRWGDVVLFERFGRIYAHRLIFRCGDWCWTKGDARWAWDRPPPRRDEVFAVATALVTLHGERRPIQRSRRTALYQLARALCAWPFLGIRRA
jgi:hypothetical protein